MKTSIKIAAIGVTSIAMAASITAPALAWHPKGEIKKYVTNETQKGPKSDANDTKTAVNAKPGDILRYTIEVKNVAPAAQKEWNDMHFTKMTDTLPVGVELVDGGSKTITADMGVILPGKSVTKEYTVKVTASKDGEVVTNEACFTADSKVKDNKQSGCDKAVIKVINPKVEVPETPTTPVTPVTPETPEEAPEVLPNTGLGNIVLPASIATALGYAGNMLRLKRRNKN
jgi:uncharacterized repeat protein (TIGR01451 family)